MTWSKVHSRLRSIKHLCAFFNIRRFDGHRDRGGVAQVPDDAMLLVAVGPVPASGDASGRLDFAIHASLPT